MFARISEPITYHEGARRDFVRISAVGVSVSSGINQHSKVLNIHHAEQAPNAWDVLEWLAGSIDGPSDWSSNHDHYLYGTVKRDE